MSYASNAKRGHEILLSIQNEIEGGWIFSVKQLIAAEIFSDFLEMAEHLLKQGYKDPCCCNDWKCIRGKPTPTL